ncbi:MAG: bactofilin family protein [Thermodesulfobacteriota bacterium]
MGGKTKNLSIIDKDLRVEGELSSEGKLVIKGVVKGSISGESVIIAEEGQVYSDMEVNDLTIGGGFEGKVQALGKVVILSSGKCTGTVTCNDLIVESGGIINAEVVCTKDEGEVSKGFLKEVKANTDKKKWLKKKDKDENNKDKDEKVL